jgi:hypothetical protein
MKNDFISGFHGFFSGVDVILFLREGDNHYQIGA